jgi:hypothetical protein
MGKPNFSALLPSATLRQLEELQQRFCSNRTQIVIRAIALLHKQEIREMKQIKTGETNDLHLYAVEVDGQYFPLAEADLNFEKPDAKIFYDSGIYPGVTDLPQYICGKAKELAQ